MNEPLRTRLNPLLSRARTWGLLLVVAVIGLAVGLLLRPAGTPRQELPATGPAGSQEHPQHVTIWTCSMHPEVRLPAPGRCPKCGMTLIPLETEGARTAHLPRLTISPQARALMDIETAPVERKFVTAQIRMVGKVDFDETRQATITAWVAGRLDRLYVDYTGLPVRKGDHMVLMYSPELLRRRPSCSRRSRPSRTSPAAPWTSSAARPRPPSPPPATSCACSG